MKEHPTKEGQEYRGYFSRCIHALIEDGFHLPAIRKADGKTYRFQFTGHLHVMEALQGLWERHNKPGEYTIRAKLEYKALYYGTIFLLEEEQALAGRDNDREITKLQEWIEMERPAHKTRKILAEIKAEIVLFLNEIDDGLMTQEKFKEKMQNMITFSFEEKDRSSMSIHVDRIITEEILKRKNVKYQHSHRELEKFFKGIQAVT